VSRKAAKVPRLLQALQNREITPSVAKKMISVLNRENAEEMIAFAQPQRSQTMYLSSS
jgi:hypothetical protein